MRLSVLAAACLVLLANSSRAADQSQRLRAPNASPSLNSSAGNDAFIESYCEDMWRDGEYSDSKKNPLQNRQPDEQDASSLGCAMASMWIDEKKTKEDVLLLSNFGDNGALFAVKNSRGEQRAVKCMRMNINSIRSELCAQHLANRKSTSEEDQVAPHVHDAWVCGDRSRESMGCVYGCYEMQHVAEMGATHREQTMVRLLTTDIAKAQAFQLEVFRDLKRSMDSGANHGSLLLADVGVLSNGRPVLSNFLWGSVCRTAVPWFMQPAKFTLAIQRWHEDLLTLWRRGVPVSRDKIDALDVHNIPWHILEGKYELFSHMPLTHATHTLTDMPGVAAKLNTKNMRADSSAANHLHWLIDQVATHGHVPYLPHRMSLVLEKSSDGKTMLVRDWSVEGTFHTWAESEAAAAAVLQGVRENECTSPMVEVPHRYHVVRYPHAKITSTVDKDPATSIERTTIAFTLNYSGPPPPLKAPYGSSGSTETESVGENEQVLVQ